MISGTVQLGELPRLIKAAFVLFAFHIAVYSAYVAWSAIGGATVHPLWVLHILAALYFLSEIRRPNRRPTILIGYCFVMSFLIFRTDYRDAIAMERLAEAIPQSLLCVLPLLFAGVCVILGRRFYAEGASAA